MRNKVLIFIDVVAHKNQLQTEALFRYGFEPYFFVSKYNKRSESFLQKPGEQILLENTFLKRWKQVRSWLRKQRSSIHHIEVYPGGRFSFIYFLLAKMNRIPTVCVERGDLLYYHSRGYSRSVRFSMWLCYKLADIVWYREPYMKPILEKLNSKLYFLHNAVKAPPGNQEETKVKDITFLWLNRIIPQRRADWFIDILKKPELTATRNYLAGIDPASLYKKEQAYIEENKTGNIEIAEYTSEPEALYKRSRFFVLPADVVFANHSLLEAMSYGIVPLISNQQGSSLIVQDGKEGFIFNHTKEDLETVMLRALHLPEEVYNQMSQAAAEKIKKEFSEEKYKEAIKILYDRLDP